MTKHDKGRDKITLDKSKEMRTKEISKMIGEGGLGARTYYDIKKDPSAEQKPENSNDQDNEE